MFVIDRNFNHQNSLYQKKIVVFREIPLKSI